ncbi:MAG: restriction endonuclease subunit R, partial [Nostoc sp. CreGUA01]
MVQFIQAQNIGLAYLEERFNLQLAEDEAFFTEWLENLPEITDLEKQDLDKVKLHFLRLVRRPPLSEETVKLVVLSPLLNLAGFYDEPFYIRGEQSIEISAEDKGEVIRGRIDILVIQEQLWILVIESKGLPKNKLFQEKRETGFLKNNNHFKGEKRGCRGQPLFSPSSMHEESI